ncbi:MAG: FtsW/RodA/SpoVE family cell cycle protein [Ruminococcaceae bacterium]|nr:FtsW/RodA/SpoVE family cell cycle protein [Oscillospiraceae bacterium]
MEYEIDILNSYIRDILINAVDKYPLFFSYFTALSRYILVFIALLIAIRTTRSLFKKSEPETWGYLDLPNGLHIPINHWENVIGRARKSDIVLNFNTVSRTHAALIRKEDGLWEIIDLNSKTGVMVNGEKVEGKSTVDYGDSISFGGIETRLSALSSVERTIEEIRTPPGVDIKPSFTIYLITIFQILLCLQLCFANPSRFDVSLPVCFILTSTAMWAYFIIFRIMKNRGFEVESIAFFLSSVGLGVTAASEPFEMYKHFLAFLIGLLFFIMLGWLIRDVKRANSMRWFMGAAAIGLLMSTAVLGTVVNGAKNWLYIAGFSIQPSEIAKVCFVFAGTATLDRLFAKRNLIMYLLLTAVCGGLLAFSGDFGAALIFFVVFLVVSFMRTGDIATLALITFATAFGGMITLKFKPYIMNRFSVWGKAWQFPHDGGFQQARTMSAAASGGLFGVGAGNGWLNRVVAADTDLVFGVVSEELGLLIGLVCIYLILMLAVFAAKSTMTGRSTFYSIMAVAATSMLVFQMMLNVLGSVDILPLTGVTFPFVSNGGSSMVSCFGMMAFVKAADTRRNASFAIKNESIFFRSKIE